jgi:3-deoxy-7-phosphoheptulonate synthase
MTGEDHVTECVGGSCGLADDDLHAAYETQCDPRLNGQQAIELTFKLVDVLKRRARRGARV